MSTSCGTTKKTIRAGLLTGAALTLLVTAGCGNNATQPAPSAAAQTPSTSSAPTTTSAPTPPSTTTQSSAADTPPAHVDTIDYLTKEGYKAHITIKWNTYGVISPSDVFPGCIPAATDPEVKNKLPENLVYYAVTADLKAEFPSVAGFEWPKTREVPLDMSVGGTNRCYGGKNVHTVSPAYANTSFMWLDVVEKTPNNPTGLPKDRLTDVAIMVYGDGGQGGNGPWNTCDLVGDGEGFRNYWCNSNYPYAK